MTSDFGVDSGLLMFHTSARSGRDLDDSCSSDDDSIGPLPVLQKQSSMKRLKAPNYGRSPSTSTLRRARSLQPRQTARVNVAHSSDRVRRPDPPSDYAPDRLPMKDPFKNFPPRRMQSEIRTKPPKRTHSLPILGSRKGRREDKKEDGTANQDNFSPKASKFISRAFPEDKMTFDHDVWVQRMVIREGKQPKLFFKSVFSRECRREPPTGALNIIYMEDMIKLQAEKATPEAGKSLPKHKMRFARSKSKQNKTAGQKTNKQGAGRSWKASFGFGGKAKTTK